MSKGSNRRPCKLSHEEMQKRWDEAFKKAKPQSGEHPSRGLDGKANSIQTRVLPDR